MNSIIHVRLSDTDINFIKYLSKVSNTTMSDVIRDIVKNERLKFTSGIIFDKSNDTIRVVVYDCSKSRSNGQCE